MVRSPSSPLPMSAQAQHYYGSEDEEDLREAVKAQEKFQKARIEADTARETLTSRKRQEEDVRRKLEITTVEVEQMRERKAVESVSR